ncbi:MAG TPA: NAD(P)/FAD-dependent oxidoreductase [Candidatus Binatia bacterium]|nr:NAD(P)/FAD-dependent oxidoreductase [Candidatus Binatia bacterium]
MPTADKFDLAIIGGGPAGTSAAITAARLGISVALFEAREYPRHKVCGEFVSAEALGVLANLLKDVPCGRVLLGRAPAISSTRFWLGPRMLEAAVLPAGISIARFDLDSCLWRAAQAAGAEALAGCEVRATIGGGPFELQTSAGVIRARALIVAAGRWSQLLRDRTIPPGPRWIGVKGHFRARRPDLCTDLYFFDRGYCGVQPVSEDVVNACAMVRADQATSMPEVLRLHAGLEQQSRSWIPVTQTITTAPLIYRRPQPVDGNVIFAGDAAAFIDPYVGDGISIALRSGRVAAQSVCRFLDGEISLSDAAALYEREYSRQFAPLWTAASRVRPLLSLPPLARAAVFELLRLPGLMPYLIRRTRRANIGHHRRPGPCGGEA